MNLTKRETATVLAGLRILQNLSLKELVGLDHFNIDCLVPMTPDQIDKLCERINIEERKNMKPLKPVKAKHGQRPAKAARTAKTVKAKSPSKGRRYY